MKATASQSEIKAKGTAGLKKLSYLEIAQELRRRIKNGQWKAGEKLPSYSESRVMFGAHSVALEKAHAELEREGLIVRERGRGTFVAQICQPRLRTSTNLIGLAGKGFAFQGYSPYWVSLLRGIRKSADELGVSIILLDFQSNLGWEKADGVLMCDWNQTVVSPFLPSSMPSVSVMVPAENRSSVYADDYSGGKIAAEYLLRLGHTRIAYMHTYDILVTGRRLAGYREALTRAGISPCLNWERSMRDKGGPEFNAGEDFIKRGRDVMRQWLSQDWKKTGCTAILTQNDEAALGVIEALKEAKIRVPQDVSVVGYDAVSHEYSADRLTSVRVPLEEIGQRSVRRLLDQIDKPECDNLHHAFPVTIREGESTSPPRPTKK
jgi:DNA-binding LacI/PurR family transcriptional regulator